MSAPGKPVIIEIEPRRIEETPEPQIEPLPDVTPIPEKEPEKVPEKV